MGTAKFTSSISIALLALLLCSSQKMEAQYYENAEFCCGKQEDQYFSFIEMQYPEKAIENNEEGKVKLSFTLNPDGSKNEIEINKSVSPEVDREAIRLLRLQVWKPAIREGEKVKSREETSFKFNIRKYKKAVKERGYGKIEYPHTPIDTGFGIYRVAELDKIPDPIFKNENQNLGGFIMQEMEYPEMAYKMNISGTVKLGFILEKSGNVSHVSVLESVGGGCDQEAIRILKKIRWMPGIKDGKAVRSRATLKITFKLNSSGHRYMPNNQNNSF